MLIYKNGYQESVDFFSSWVCLCINSYIVMLKSQLNGAQHHGLFMQQARFPQWFTSCNNAIAQMILFTNVVDCAVSFFTIE